MFKLIKKHGLSKYLTYRKYYRDKMRRCVLDNFVTYSMMMFPEDIGETEILNMKSGKRGLFKTYYLNFIGDWYGSKNIKQDFVGYVGIKPIRECNLEEFIELYDGLLSYKQKLLLDSVVRIK